MTREMTARAETKFGESGTQFRARVHRKDIVRAAAVLPEHVQRQKHLATRGVTRQQSDDIRDRLSLSGLDSDFFRSLTKDPCRTIKNRAGRV